MSRRGKLIGCVMVLALAGCETLPPAGSALPGSGTTSEAPPDQFSVNVSVQGEGSVVLDPPGGIYSRGTTVTLNAVANPSWFFDHWEGDLTGKETGAVLTVEGDRNVVGVFTEISVELVLLDGLPVGSGLVFVDPVGEPAGTGLLYPVGTTVTLTAVADPGWVFVSWYGDLESTEVVLELVLTHDTAFFALFEDITPPPAIPILGAQIVADNGQFLGIVSTNSFDSNSIANPYGPFGNTYSVTSIWNSYGSYGSSYAILSPYNSYTTTPPSVYVDGLWHSYLTKNTFLAPRTDPDDLARAIGRPEVARD